MQGCAGQVALLPSHQAVSRMSSRLEAQQHQVLQKHSQLAICLRQAGACRQRREAVGQLLKRQPHEEAEEQELLQQAAVIEARRRQEAASQRTPAGAHRGWG